MAVTSACHLVPRRNAQDNAQKSIVDARGHEKARESSGSAHNTRGNSPGNARARSQARNVRPPTRVTCKFQIFKMEHARAPPFGESDRDASSASAHAISLYQIGKVTHGSVKSSSRFSFLSLVTIVGDANVAIRASRRTTRR